MMKYSGTWLKEKQRKRRSSFPDNLGLRVHRAISWIQKAEAEVDLDAQFIFSWIALNACYAEYTNHSINQPERQKLTKFFSTIVELDSEKLVYEAIWRQYSEAIRTILSNKFVFNPFWNHHNQITGYENWQESLKEAKKLSLIALKDRNTSRILNIVFDRLYVLRNQLVHGGATHSGGINRAQVKDGAAILNTLIPLFVNIMMDHPEATWGRSFYPVTGD